MVVSGQIVIFAERCRADRIPPLFARVDLVRAQILTDQEPRFDGEQTRWKTCGEGWQFYSGSNGELLRAFSHPLSSRSMSAQALAGSL